MSPECECLSRGSSTATPARGRWSNNPDFRREAMVTHFQTFKPTEHNSGMTLRGRRRRDVTLITTDVTCCNVQQYNKYVPRHTESHSAVIQEVCARVYTLHGRVVHGAALTYIHIIQRIRIASIFSCQPYSNACPQQSTADASLLCPRKKISRWVLVLWGKQHR